MKKLCLLVLALVLLVALSGCGGSSHDGVSEKTYEFGVAALETIDEYLDGDIDYKAADYRIGTAADGINRNMDAIMRDAGATVMSETDFPNDNFVSHHILLARHEMAMKEGGAGTKKEIIEHRNKLASYLGEKSR